MSEQRDVPVGRSSKDKPAGPAAAENSGGGTDDRQEVGNAASSRRDPPHVTANDEGPIQEGQEGEPAPVLPANAGGRDQFTAEEQDEEIDEESAYDRRSSQDKDNPPSDR